MPYCPKCGKEVTEEMNVCPYCGNPLKVMPTQREVPVSRVTVGTKNSGLAAVLSLIIPGLGQMYAGQIGKRFIVSFRCCSSDGDNCPVFLLAYSPLISAFSFLDLEHI